MESRKENDKEEITMDLVKKLIAARDEIDQRIAKEEEILKINNIDMKQSLVDKEGFPITSVDVYAVRQARCAIICAQNDRQKLTAEIEKAMLILHQQKRDCTTTCSEHATDDIPIVHRTSNAPFAKVAKVMNASPAFRAGLKDGDQLIQFGSLHAGNFTDIKELSIVVQNSMNKPIRVTVLRDNRPIRLELIPQMWSGKGTLGCSVLPVTPAHI
ncbi:Probable 26S proteasome non-ATPase regulatory subunit 9, putative [Brugia malayi]|uniref:26S proteasome non-ATPase regulatory subunit 9 n=3 Tax=Brugia malayi TaxID=6279 RepID=A0A0K0J790_BRUMA|nr:putative 26S proteasome non-ATPase regulatory subunit 9, putative [Brugia malayi]CDP91010.1 Bm2738 [Brugia malayi]VIO89993.1 Probable 26S proteasome non-ATPase regulatory subunit 9, putative [Brugia malayi]